MNVTLKSFCEDILLVDPKNSRSFLVFERDGEEFRIPVQRETIEVLAKHIYKKPAQVEEPVPEEEDHELIEEPEDIPEPTDATVFGGDEDESESDELPPDNDDPIGALELRRIPTEEDGVPPL